MRQPARARYAIVRAYEHRDLLGDASTLDHGIQEVKRISRERSSAVIALIDTEDDKVRVQAKDGKAWWVTRCDKCNDGMSKDNRFIGCPTCEGTLWKATGPA